MWVGTGEANNASENQYGVGVFRLARGSDTWQQVGGAELYGAGSYRIVWIRDHVYVATSHGLYRRSVNAPRSQSWRLVLAPAGVIDYPPSSSVTDVIAAPGTQARGPGGRRVGRLQRPARPFPTTGSTSVTGRPGTFTRITPTGDINPATIGRTTFSSSNGWLYAVVQDTDQRRPARPRRLRVALRQPGRSVDADRRHGQARRVRLGSR